jgi:hypothetical protein
LIRRSGLGYRSRTGRHRGKDIKKKQMSAITGPGERLYLCADEGQCRILPEGFDLADRNP